MLGQEVGLAWPQTGTLTVREAVSHSTGGYAGLFDPAKGVVEIAYYADPFVVLHESAHGWFNGSLLADRWANEGFASYYALQAATALKVKATGDVLTTKLKAARIPLNAWGPIGRDTGATEDYAYAASLALAKAIGERATPDVLQAVWADAAGHVGAYQPPSGGTPETVDGAPDWRGLLDLLEAESGNRFDDLWRTWVARDEDLPLLDARAAARTRYDQVVGDAGDWTLPKPIRDAMRAWRFDDATRMLDEASAVLARRATIETNAAAVGLTPSPALEAAFEGDDGFADATAEADAEDIAIAAYRDAVAARPAGADPVTRPGPVGRGPRGDARRREDGVRGRGPRRVGPRRGGRRGHLDRRDVDRAGPVDQPRDAAGGHPAGRHPGHRVGPRADRPPPPQPDAGAPHQVVTGPRRAAAGAAARGPYATLAATSGPVPPADEAASREEGSTPD